MKKFITENSKETQKLGELFAQELLADKLEKSKVICLEGDLGAGKTTFTQGLLKGFGAEGPYTSPTFVIMKEYKIKKFKVQSSKFKVYHIDAYRISDQDMLNLGWEEIISAKNVVIVEWPEKIRNIISKNSLWINFKWLDKDKRKIEF